VPSIYQPRRPRASPLWQILTAAWDSFLANYEKKHRPALGPLRPNVFTAVRNFLRCGDLASGFNCMPAEDLTPAIELFRHRFLQALRDGKHISPSRLADLLSWKHSGFNIHDGGEKPVPSHDTEGRKRLAE
jgi:hypothetical protein